MSRQIKTVSIPERLKKRVDSMENFSGFVVAAIENEDERIAALRIAALQRQITALREEFDDVLEGLGIDLGNIRRSNNPKTGIIALQNRLMDVRAYLRGDA